MNILKVIGSLQSWDKSLVIDCKHWKNITRANMNEFADDQLGRTKIYIDKMNESSTMFPVKVTLNELPDQVFASVPFVSISKLDSFLRYYEFLSRHHITLSVASHTCSPVHHYFIN